MGASDKLFYWLFHNTPDLILRWLQDLPADAAGYSFSAPVLKEREYRLDGLFSPPQQRDDMPAVVLEAQMAANPDFLLRLYAESARLLQQERWQKDWQVVLICPHRHMNFGPLTPVREVSVQGADIAFDQAKDTTHSACTAPCKAEAAPSEPTGSHLG